MQGPFTQNEPEATKREFVFFLVDATDHTTPETGETGGQPQIRKAGETAWTNTTATLVAIGNGHYTLTLAVAELVTLGCFSIRYKSANTDEFQDVGRATSSSDDISLNEINSKLDYLSARVHVLEFKLGKGDSASKPTFLSPL
jgi:hypothetical protein